MNNSTEINNMLIRRLQGGDEKALTELCLYNAGLVKSIALRYVGTGNELEDLIQIGNIGLIKASRGFDFSYNTVFSTYAVVHIIGEIKRFLRDDGSIKIARETRKNAFIISKARQAFENENMREPTVKELAELCRMHEEEVTQALCASYGVRSLAEKIGDSDDITLESMIEDSNDKIKLLTDNIALAEAVSKLDKLQRAIVHLRYTKELTQAQTGKILGISQVKVSREEKKLLLQLKTAL